MSPFGSAYPFSTAHPFVIVFAGCAGLLGRTRLKGQTALLAGAATLVIAATLPQTAYADPTLPDIPAIDFSTILPKAATRSILKTIGILTNHRPYRGASSTSASSFDIGVEATLVHQPSDFASSLKDAGLGTGAAGIPSLPMAKLHVNKGLSQTVDVGLSGIYFRSNYIAGGDLKVTFYQPEEGMSLSARLGFSLTRLDLSDLGVGRLPIKIQGNDLGSADMILVTQTWTPQLVASQKLDFAETYMALGYDFTSGQIRLPITVNVLQSTQTLASPSYASSGLFATLGVGFRFFPMPLVLSIEGTYSALGMHALGLMFGLGF